MSAPRRLGPAGRFAHAWISSKLTPLLIAAALLVGAFAVWKLPREEEPQIIVPMIDIMVEMPGASAHEVEERITKPMEKLLWEIPGVEYIYSTSSPGSSLAIVRFYVGQDEEKSIVRLNQKMQANFDLIPPGASQPLVKPRSIDDVPILALTLSSPRYGDFELRRIAAQLDDAIKQVPDVSAVSLIGGERRAIRIVLDESKLAAYNLSPLQVTGALGMSNRRLPSGEFASGNREYVLETGEFLRTAEDVRSVVAGVANDKPVYVRDVAEVSDGGEEPTDYVRTADAATRQFLPAVTLAVSKRKGTNAVIVAGNVLRRIEPLKGSRHSVGCPRGDHARLWQDGRGKVQRAALPHADRGGLGEPPDRHHAGVSRVPHRVHRHPRHPGPHAGGFLSLRLHPEPHHAVRPHFFHRHPGG